MYNGRLILPKPQDPTGETAFTTTNNGGINPTMFQPHGTGTLVTTNNEGITSTLLQPPAINTLVSFRPIQPVAPSGRYQVRTTAGHVTPPSSTMNTFQCVTPTQPRPFPFASPLKATPRPHATRSFQPVVPMRDSQFDRPTYCQRNRICRLPLAKVEEIDRKNEDMMNRLKTCISVLKQRISQLEDAHVTMKFVLECVAINPTQVDAEQITAVLDHLPLVVKEPPLPVIPLPDSKLFSGIHNPVVPNTPPISDEEPTVMNS